MNLHDLLSAAMDPQRASVYEAEESASENVVDGGDYLESDQLDTWVREVMRRAGWSGDAAPRITLDVADGSDLSGWHEGATGIIHLHPKLLSPWNVLHELAHWHRPMDGHGAQFCGVLVGLVRAGISEDAAWHLREAYRDLDVDVDESWTES